MPICEVCGTDYDKTFEIILSGRRHVFDSFECAIHGLAPRCEHCHSKIEGHGIESNIRRCASCAGQNGVS